MSPRAREFFVPEVRGLFWRKVVNAVGGTEKFSIDALEKLYSSCIVVDNQPFDLPYSQFVTGSGLQDEIQRHIAVARNAYRFFETYSSKIERALAEALAKGGAYSHPPVASKWIPEQLRGSLESACIAEMFPEEGKKGESFAAQVFWQNGGYASYSVDFGLLTLARLSLLVENHNPISDALPMPFQYRILPPEWNKAAISWWLERVKDSPVGAPNLSDGARFMESIRLGISALIPISDLECLRELAVQTWTQQPSVSRLSTKQLLTLWKYISLGGMELTPGESDWGTVTPFALKEKRILISRRDDDFSGRFPFPYFPAYDIIANAFVDFWDDLNWYNLFEAYKGSFQCQQCGTFIERNFDGYGQKYCSDQCYKRAAKYRARQNKEKRKEQS